MAKRTDFRALFALAGTGTGAITDTDTDTGTGTGAITDTARATATARVKARETAEHIYYHLVAAFGGYSQVGESLLGQAVAGHFRNGRHFHWQSPWKHDHPTPGVVIEQLALLVWRRWADCDDRGYTAVRAEIARNFNADYNRGETLHRVRV